MGEMATAEFVSEFLGEVWRDREGGLDIIEDEEEEQTETRRGAASRRAKGKGRSNGRAEASGSGARESDAAKEKNYLDRVMKDITRAAAGGLTEVKVMQ